MQVKAIYEDGVLNFTQPLRFKRRKFEVLVSIPEDELDEAVGDLMASAATEEDKAVGAYVPIGERLDDILGTYRGKLGNVTPLAVKEIWHEHLEEKHHGNK